MKVYFYRRSSGEVIRIECEQMFWSGTACVFVKGGLASAVVSLLPGEIVCEKEIVEQKDERTGNPKYN